MVSKKTVALCLLGLTYINSSHTMKGQEVKYHSDWVAYPQETENLTLQQKIAIIRSEITGLWGINKPTQLLTEWQKDRLTKVYKYNIKTHEQALDAIKKVNRIKDYLKKRAQKAYGNDYKKQIQNLANIYGCDLNKKVYFTIKHQTQPIQVKHYTRTMDYIMSVPMNLGAWVARVKQEAILAMRFLDNPHRLYPIDKETKADYNRIEFIKNAVNKENVRDLHQALILIEKDHDAIPYINYMMGYEPAQTTAQTPVQTPVQIPVVQVNNIEYQIISSILGGAIGDAMGYPTECMNFGYGDSEAKLQKILKKYPGGLKSFNDFKQSDFRTINGKKTAIYTDDTAMSKVVMNVLIQAKKNSWSMEKTMENLAEAFVIDMHKSDGWNAGYRAPGKSCQTGCQELEKRINSGNTFGKWWQAGPDSKGCGSVMRAHPFGLIFAKDPKKAEKWAAEHSKLTHQDKAAVASSAAMAVGVAYAIQGKSVDFIVKKMIESAAKYDYDYTTAQKVKDAYSAALSLEQKGNKSFDFLFNNSKHIFAKYLGWYGDDALAATVYIFALSPDNIQTAIALGVNGPGDTDSIASMAGALVGAYGKSNIKESSIELIEKSKELIGLGKDISNLYK